MTANLRTWLREQGLSVRELAAGLRLPPKTVEDWVYRGVQPSPANIMRLQDFMCTHHWVIDAANGHTSRGVCQHCNEVREFENSTYGTVWKPPQRDTGGRPM